MRKYNKLQRYLSFVLLFVMFLSNVLVPLDIFAKEENDIDIININEQTNIEEEDKEENKQNEDILKEEKEDFKIEEKSVLIYENLTYRVDGGFVYILQELLKII